MKWKEVIKKKELPKDFVPSGDFRADAKRLGIAVRPTSLTDDEIEQYRRHLMGESKTPQERVSTTPSTGQPKRMKRNFWLEYKKGIRRQGRNRYVMARPT